jgi:hypothetical protein
MCMCLRVFELSPDKPKIILATNIAEASLTIRNVRTHPPTPSVPVRYAFPPHSSHWRVVLAGVVCQVKYVLDFGVSKVRSGVGRCHVTLPNFLSPSYLLTRDGQHGATVLPLHSRHLRCTCACRRCGTRRRSTAPSWPTPGCPRPPPTRGGAAPGERVVRVLHEFNAWPCLARLAVCLRGMRCAGGCAMGSACGCTRGPSSSRCPSTRTPRWPYDPSTRCCCRSVLRARMRLQADAHSLTHSTWV